MFSFKSLLTVVLLLQTAAAAGYVNAAYYASWKQYNGHPIEALNFPALSHVIYAFASISANGTVQPTDAFADYQMLHDGDVAQTGNNAYGNVKQLYLQKKANRKLKTLLSIGGYTASQNGDFINASKNEPSRNRFINSAIKLMLDYGMDGIDLDWEYPTSKAQGENFYLIIKNLRDALDAKSKALGQNYKYLLTAAVPASPDNYSKMPLSKMNARLDFFNLMAYDYAGSWSPVAAHASALYNDKSNPKSTPLNTDTVVKGYLASGVSANKINLGIPLFGKSFAKAGGLGKSYSGTLGDKNDYSIPFYNLPKAGAKVIEKPDAGALVTWDSKTKELVTLDGGYSAKLKSAYLKKQGLAGAFFWDSSGDKTGKNSLMTITKSALGSLENTNNQLMYPSSEFVNIRNGVPTSKK
jgi:chitinase